MTDETAVAVIGHWSLVIGHWSLSLRLVLALRRPVAAAAAALAAVRTAALAALGTVARLAAFAPLPAFPTVAPLAVAARLPGRRPPAGGRRPAALALGLLAQQRLARQLDAVVLVDGDHLHLDLVADLDHVLDLADVLVVQLADVAQA